MGNNDNTDNDNVSNIAYSSAMPILCATEKKGFQSRLKNVKRWRVKNSSWKHVLN